MFKVLDTADSLLLTQFDSTTKNNDVKLGLNVVIQGHMLA